MYAYNIQTCTYSLCTYVYTHTHSLVASYVSSITGQHCHCPDDVGHAQQGEQSVRYVAPATEEPLRSKRQQLDTLLGRRCTDTILLYNIIIIGISLCTHAHILYVLYVYYVYTGGLWGVMFVMWAVGGDVGDVGCGG